MSKFLNEGDFFMCTGGMMPAKMKSGQVTTSKKSAVKYIRITDVQTTSFGDFVCKKLMLLMAVAAVLFALLCAVTGGAALIAAAAIGGAVGAAAGALICGTKAAAARKWLMPKQQVYINGQLALTDSSYMICTAVGTEQIRLAPHIKNWWQAIAVGVTNFAGEMFKCIMVGAAAAGGIVLLTEGAGAFLSNVAANYLLTWTSGWGLALRGGIGAMGAVQSKYVGGDSTGDALLHGAQGSAYGMEQGTAQSMGNIATGQGKPEDYAALLAWGAPIAPEAKKGPVDPDAMAGNPWEGKPQSGKTGFLESKRMSRSELTEYKEGLKDQGIGFEVDKNGHLPDNVRAGFDNQNGKVYLRKGATNYEAFHEAQHAKQWRELGKDAYMKQSRAEREQYVYDQIVKNKGQFSDAELNHARNYINSERSKAGLPPVLDAMEGGTPKKGENGDLFEDPTVVKNEAESVKANDEIGAKPEEFKVGDEIAGKPIVNVREGTNGKVAVIGRKMAGHVEDVGANLEGNGKNVELFNEQNQSNKLFNIDGETYTWKEVADDFGNKGKYVRNEKGWIVDSDLKNTLMYKANEQWAGKLAAEKYTVIDMGYPPDVQSNSVFYDMERNVIFGK
ncbi:hypothetical protein ABIB62_003559 [Mucilaginibacter sp. UYP25]|uniref:zincin-like metallopeptidase toxin domain-containing protein n=1 Tax=unclassified Mucilaginibacter TaxID=2617802 RepID=UPI00339B1030